MKRFAIVELNDQRIERTIEIGDNWDVLPIVEIIDDVGENQVLGAPEVSVEKDHVRSHQRALRALKGRVAILDDAGGIASIKDLGDELVQVADNVRIYEEEKPDFDGETEELIGPKVTITPERARRVWTKRKVPAKELAARRDAEEEAAIDAKFGEAGIQVAFDQENRLRLLEGKNRFASIEEYRAELKATL